jgi:surface antigen
MILFTEAKPPELSPLISIVIEQKQEAPLVEYTLEEKIQLNVNQCDEATQWIRADNAECLDKRVNTPVRTENTSEPIKNGSYAPSGWYPYGQCTYWVASNRSVGQWNNASQWLYQARRDGWTTGTTPRVGAIAWEPNHVSLVTSVNGDGTITVSEMNYKGLGVVSTRTAPATQFSYIY